MEKISPHIGMKRDGKEEFRSTNLSGARRKAKIFDMYSGKEYLVRLQCQNRIADYIIDKFGKDNLIQLLNLMKQLETVMSSEVERMGVPKEDDRTIE